MPGPSAVDVRAVGVAENRMHDMILKGQTSYAQLEAVAVLAGVGPRGPDSRDVPDGRWSLHPDGYFVSYQPHDYSWTTVSVDVAEPIRVERDAAGRIASLTGLP